MPHFVKGTYFSKKNGKLHIYVRSDTYKGKLQFKKELGLGIHESSFKDCLKEYLKYLNDDHSRSKNTIQL